MNEKEKGAVLPTPQMKTPNAIIAPSGKDLKAFEQRMRPFTKTGEFSALQRAEWREHPEKFEASVTAILAACPDKTRYQIETGLRKKNQKDEGVVYENDAYVVIKRPCSNNDDFWHLSIRRQDRQAIHDWRDLQEIKNQIVGPENEGVELYPKESRRADSANQYHLWVLKSTGCFQFGFTDRLVRDGLDERRDGSVQRPFEGGEV